MDSFSASPVSNHKRFFFEKFGITERLLERCLGEALSAGGDYADLYFESVMAISLGVDEQIVKSASQGTSAGCGIRVISGERTGYAYTDNLNADRLMHAAKTAALIAQGPAKQPVQGFTEAPAADLYPVPVGGFDLDLAARLELILRADRAARAYDARMTQVRANYAEEVAADFGGGIGWIVCQRHAAAGAAECVCDCQGERREDGERIGGRGRTRGAGRNLQEPRARSIWRRKQRGERFCSLARCRRRQAKWKWCWGRAGRESCCMRRWGMGWRRTSTARGTSAFTGLIGRPVASPLVTVVDNGTMEGRRGSLNVDDEGSPTQETVLIENGVLKGYLTDKLSARLMGTANTGSGRRESYHSIPMPRMTNTYMLAGQDDPEDIIRSVKRGLYAPNFGGGRWTSPAASSCFPRRKPT